MSSHSFSLRIPFMFIVKKCRLASGRRKLSIFLSYNSNYRRHYAILCRMIKFSLSWHFFVLVSKAAVAEWRKRIRSRHEHWDWMEAVERRKLRNSCFSFANRKTFSIITLNYGPKNLINSGNSSRLLPNAAQIFAHQIFRLCFDGFLHSKLNGELSTLAYACEKLKYSEIVIWKFRSVNVFLRLFHYINDSQKPTAGGEEKVFLTI